MVGLIEIISLQQASDGNGKWRLAVESRCRLGSKSQLSKYLHFQNGIV